MKVKRNLENAGKIGLASLISTLPMASCGPSLKNVSREKVESERVTQDIPDWYLNVPTSADTLYAVGTGLSRDLGFALRKAQASAIGDLVRSIESHTEVSGNETRTTSRMTLYGTSSLRNQFHKEGDLYRGYVLVGIPKENLKHYEER